MPKNQNLPVDRDILEGLLPSPLQTVAKPSDSTDIDREGIKVKDLKYVGSYNWVESKQPTIIVPGSPPYWLNKATPYQVSPDSGVVFKNQNGFRFPNAIFLPLVQAVEMNNADFDWSAIDFVTDRNGLRKLLRWISTPDPKNFRIDTQLAGKHTVLLNRWENGTRESMDGRGYSTYGFSFEKASTKPAQGCEDSTGHHRIVKYDFGGFTIVVRFEVDACIPPPATRSRVASKPDMNALTDALAGVSLSSASNKKVQIDTSGLHIIQAGVHIPQSNIVELTTVSKMRHARFDWSEAYSQLFLSQTPHHFLAVHDRGRFNMVEKRKLGSEDLDDIEETTQIALWKLMQALDTIKNMVVEHGKSGRLSLVCQAGEMKVYERSSQESCLPEDVLKKFEV